MEYGSMSIQRLQSGRWLNWGIRFFLTAALTASQTAGGYAPFALGCIAAAGPGADGAAALLGGVTGALLFLDFQQVLALAAVGILILTAATAFRDTAFLQKPWVLPVLAAGGIGDGRGIAAAFLLGAVGVQVGTRFLVAEECGVHENYKKKVLKANDIATMVTGKRLGHPVRQIKNQFAKEYAKAEYSQISDEELEKMGSGALYRAAVLGDEKTGDFLAGQIAGMVNKEQPAAEIIKEMFTQAEEVLKGADKWVK